MGIEVRWTWAHGQYEIEGAGDGVEVRVRTANLGYASELTRLLLQSAPSAFAPVSPIAETAPASEIVLTPEQEARMAAADPPEPIDVLNVEKAVEP